MPSKISRGIYADMYGPTTGDRVRLADTDLIIEVEHDLTYYGEEVKFGGGKVIRDGMGQSQVTRADGAVDTVITNAFNKIYKEWKKRNQKLGYMFETEVSDVLLKKSINQVLEVKKGQHPILLKKFLGKEISLETMCIMDEIIGFTKDWERLITEHVVYPEVHIKINKYKSFLSYDQTKYKNKLLEICQK